MVTRKDGATDAVKKALLSSVWGKDMVTLFDHLGMVEDGKRSTRPSTSYSWGCHRMERLFPYGGLK